MLPLVTSSVLIHLADCRGYFGPFQDVRVLRLFNAIVSIYRPVANDRTYYRKSQIVCHFRRSPLGRE